MNIIKIKLKKKIFNIITYFIFVLIFDLLKINPEKLNNIYSTKYFNKSLKKDIWFNIYHNLLSNFMRYSMIRNFDKIKKNPYYDYFNSTKTNFLKKNYYFTAYRKKFIYFDLLLKKQKNIIHIGASTSFNNYHYKMKYNDKKYYQIDLNKKITNINKQLFSYNNFHNISCDISEIPSLLAKFNLEKNLIYSNQVFIYIQKKKLELFLIRLKRIKKIDLYLVETGFEGKESNFNFNNPLIFAHNYKKIFKETGWYFNKIFSDSDKNIHIARNYI